tara:strand:- start:3484 stop:5529 length:2046 start_codon:yes stop_codon:yes gene_type:complete
MRLILDVENSITKRNGKDHIDPFEKGNELVQVGTLNADNWKDEDVFTFNHKEYVDVDSIARNNLQYLLDHTELLIMHNAQHDLMWLWESGFKYDGAIYDTMLAEYILLRAQKEPLSLAACAERRDLSVQKDDTLKEYFKKGYNTNEIPLTDLSLYLRYDLRTTNELFHAQETDYKDPASATLHKCRNITFCTCKTLTRMYMSGIKVDKLALDSVRDEFKQEKIKIETELQEQVRFLMGDTPINLNSPEQLSQVIFSLKINDKKDWAGLFEYSDDFKATVKANTTVMRKTKAYTCPICKGKGKTYKVRKDGSPYAKPNKCKECGGLGYKLDELQEMAGLGFRAPNDSWVSANGFSTGKDKLNVLSATAKNNNKQDAARFIDSVKRLSAINSYLSSFVDGIYTYTKQDGYLHVGLTQHITATGRFSGRNPNMQNMPRGGTFPVKKVFVSRWDGGYIMEADFAQLEFRTAAFLAQDKVAMKEIATGFDVHSYTAKVISDAGQPTTRQEAKAHTFAPLFGATGYGRSNAEATYYTHFTKKYKGIATWHESLAEEALRFLKITNISGRQYAFPNVERRSNNKGVTYFTMIKNYPVQGLATGDIVPVVLNKLHELLKPLKSVLVNTVHDSMVVDVHPNEKDKVLSLISLINDNITDLIEDTYGFHMNVPMLLEAKIGPNWLDTKDVL